MIFAGLCLYLFGELDKGRTGNKRMGKKRREQGEWTEKKEKGW